MPKSSFIKIKHLKIHYILKNRKRYGSNFSVVFLCGYRSDLNGKKAIFIEKLQKKIGFEYLRYEYSGHGKSEGKVEERNLSNWIEESITIIDQKTIYPVILIGSSMGGWISLLIGNKIKNRLAGIIGIATAPDFTMDILKNMSRKEKLFYKKNQFIVKKSQYDKNGYSFSREFIEDSKKYYLLNKKNKYSCSIQLLYGRKDKSVKYSSQIKLLNAIKSKEISLTISDSSDHSMSSNSDLALIENSLNKIL